MQSELFFPLKRGKSVGTLRTSRRLGCGSHTPGSGAHPLPQSLRPLPLCLRGVTPLPERSHSRSPRLLRLDLLSPLWDARAAWQGTLKVPGPPTLQAEHASAACSLLPLSGNALPISGANQEIPFHSASGAEPGPAVVGMNALVRRCVARAGESPLAESCFHGNRVARFLSSSVASRGWSWKPVGREACLCGGACSHGFSACLHGVLTLWGS